MHLNRAIPSGVVACVCLGLVSALTLTACGGGGSGSSSSNIGGSQTSAQLRAADLLTAH